MADEDSLIDRERLGHRAAMSRLASRDVTATLELDGPLYTDSL
jgi:hypothetical protein